MCLQIVSLVIKSYLNSTGISENFKLDKMSFDNSHKLSLKEKIGYGLGDTASNLAWRTLTTFLLVFYTDVFGIPAAAAGILLLVTRLSDGVTDIVMGIISDRTNTKHGKFRPWILWTAVPFGAIMALTFSTPNFSVTGKLIYAYITYISLTLIYTASNVPYSALMGVMTPNQNERTSLSSFRFAGAYFGGIITQGLLILLVSSFGKIDAEININEVEESRFLVSIESNTYVQNASVSKKKGVARFVWADSAGVQEPGPRLAFELKVDEEYNFIVTGLKEFTLGDLLCINQRYGYKRSVYLLSILLILLMFITYATTKERVVPPKNQQTNVWRDLKDLLDNKPWIILLVIGFIFVTYNSVKQGITVIYFKRYINNELLAASYMVVLLLVSMVAALLTSSLNRIFDKRQLFIIVILFSGITNGLIYFAEPTNIAFVFICGTLSEFGAGIMPVLFFSMLGDSADYSEWQHGRRATGLIYSAGTFAMKFGGGVAGAIIGFILSSYGYVGTDESTVQNALPGIRILMSVIPAIIGFLGAGVLLYYPLTRKKLKEIEEELQKQRN